MFKVLKDCRISIDGISVLTFKKGDEIADDIDGIATEEVTAEIDVIVDDEITEKTDIDITEEVVEEITKTKKATPKKVTK